MRLIETNMLWPYQLKYYEELKKLEGEEGFRALVAIPTGGGKTRLAVTWAINQALAQGRKVLWLANSQYLLKQAYDEFCLAMPEEKANFILVHSGEEGHKRWEITSRHRLLICSFQSLWDAHMNAPRNDVLNLIGDAVLIIDEAHHAVAKSYFAVASRPQFKTVIGLTATPLRSKSYETGELLKFFKDSPTYRVHMSKLMEEKVLVKPFFETEPAEDGMEDGGADRLEDEEVEALLGDTQDWRRKLNGYILKTWWNKREHHGKTVIFAADTDHANNLCSLFQRAQERYKADKGPVFLVHSKAGEKDEQFGNFKKSPNGTLINVSMLREGVDIPDIQSVFLGCEIGSYIVATQIVGRALRQVRDPGKTQKICAYIVNFAATDPEKKVLFDMPKLAYERYEAEFDGNYAKAEVLEDLEDTCDEIKKQIRQKKEGLSISACCLAGYYARCSGDDRELLVTVTLRDYRRLEMFRKGRRKRFPKRLDLFKGDMEELCGEFTDTQVGELRFVPIDEELVACLEPLPRIARELKESTQGQTPSEIFKQIRAIWNDPKRVQERSRKYLQHIGIDANLFVKLMYTEFAYVDEINEEEQEDVQQ